MKTTITQKAVIANSKKKARLIDKLTTELQRAGVLVKQDPADADLLIVSTALTLAQTERKPVVVVVTDIDLLVMLISQSSSDMGIHVLCHLDFMLISSRRILIIHMALGSPYLETYV